MYLEPSGLTSKRRTFSSSRYACVAALSVTTGSPAISLPLVTAAAGASYTATSPGTSSGGGEGACEKLPSADCRIGSQGVPLKLAGFQVITWLLEKLVVELDVESAS